MINQPHFIGERNYYKNSDILNSIFVPFELHPMYWEEYNKLICKGDAGYCSLLSSWHMWPTIIFWYFHDTFLLVFDDLMSFGAIWLFICVLGI